MSQYFYSFLINCILLNVFIIVSFCDNTDHFKIVLYNNSTLEFDKYHDRNSSDSGNKPLLSQKSNNHKNHTIYKNVNVKECTYIKEDKFDNDCDTEDYTCCSIDKSMSACLVVRDHQCRGYFSAKCNSSDQCQEELGLGCYFRNAHYENEESNWRTCQCEEGFTFDFAQVKCDTSPNNYDSRTAMQIYKITMIFASCCLALILIIFLVCILRKSYCAPRPQQMVPLDNATIPDIFTLFPHVGNYDGGPLADGTQPPFEKPPTYDETLTLIRNEIGIPPPAYRSRNGSNSTNRSDQSTPQMSARVLISSPVLVTVTDSSRGDSHVQSSNDLMVAGPSGSGSSHRSDRGIDNPAFC